MLLGISNLEKYHQTMIANDAKQIVTEFLEKSTASKEFFDVLPKKLEIAIRLEDDTDLAYHKVNGDPKVSLRPAHQPDFRFKLKPEAIRQLSTMTEANLADFSIAVIKEIVMGNIGVEVLSNPIMIVKNSYWKVALTAGPKFLESLSQFGLTNGVKLLHLLQRLKAGK